MKWESMNLPSSFLSTEMLSTDAVRILKIRLQIWRSSLYLFKAASDVLNVLRERQKRRLCVDQASTSNPTMQQWLDSLLAKWLSHHFAADYRAKSLYYLRKWVSFSARPRSACDCGSSHQLPPPPTAQCFPFKTGRSYETPSPALPANV